MLVGPVIRVARQSVVCRGFVRLARSLSGTSSAFGRAVQRRPASRELVVASAVGTSGLPRLGDEWLRASATSWRHSAVRRLLVERLGVSSAESAVAMAGVLCLSAAVTSVALLAPSIREQPAHLIGPAVMALVGVVAVSAAPALVAAWRHKR